MAENATVVREIVAPDGTKYDVYADGSWTMYAWDGSFVLTDANSGLYTNDQDGLDALAAARREVVAKLGL